MVVVLVIVLILFSGIALYIAFGGPRLPVEVDEIIDGVLSRPLPELVSGQTGFATSDGLQIWFESIFPEGTPKGVVLLIMGIGGSALEWTPKVYRTFADSGYQVIRYDHRGTGLSDRIKNWDRKNPYVVADMAGDAIAVLDALGVGQAHVVGLSMGGMIAQEIAIQRPEQVASLTLMMTSGFIGDPDLPILSSEYLIGSALKGIPLLKYRILGGEKNLVKERIAKMMVAFGYEGLDVKEIAEIAIYDLRNRGGVNIAGVFQHQAAVSNSGSRYEKLRTLNIPTLVIHGTADQLIPVEHGQKLVELIPNAKALWLEGVGHIFPYPDMDNVIKHIISNFGQGSDT